MTEINRRGFMKHAGGTAALAAASTLIGGKSRADANDRIRMGIIGLNGRGGSHIEGFGALKNVEIVYLCDPDKSVLERRARAMETAGMKRPKLVQDMREIFDDKEIQCVSIATPNHWHALATIWACQAGKDVYVEKPGSHEVYEGQQVVKAIKKYDRIVQVGSQSRSNAGMREGMKKLQEGIIGEVYMAKGTCYKWRGTIGKAAPGGTAIPEGVDYNLWCGPSPMGPLMRKNLHYDWHWFWNTGNGDIGNQGIHEMDKARWGLGVGLPTEVHSAGDHFMFDDDQQTPNSMITTFRFPGTKKLLQFEVRHWITPPEAGMGEGDGNIVGNIFYGSEGYMVMPSYSSYQVFLGRKREPQPIVSKGGDHWKNFIDAVISRKREDLNAPYEDVRMSAALCHLANISYRMGESLKFDPEKERFKGNRKANKLLTRVYRKGFVVPERV